MNKGIIVLFLTIFSAVGSYVPVLLGDDGGLLGGWAILGGLVGGIFGVWLAVWVSNQYGL